MSRIMHRILVIRHLCTSTDKYFTKTALCSSENREKCLETLQNMRQLNLAKKHPERTAAVLIPVIVHSDGETLSILYTLRSANLKHHVRQVSFPGGLFDSSDNSYIDCALRETHEEIGISRNRIEIWGNGQLVIPKQGPSIMPVIGLIENYNTNMLKLNPDEVEKVFTAPINRLCSDAGSKHTQYRGMYSAPVYLGFEEKIWGITGFLTHLFLLALVPKQFYKRRLKFVTNYRL